MLLATTQVTVTQRIPSNREIDREQERKHQMKDTFEAMDYRANGDNAVSLFNETEKQIGNTGDDLFHRQVVRMNARFQELTEGKHNRLFRVSVRTDLDQVYLNAFETREDRLASNCNCCKKFLRQYGNLVTIDEETGKLQSFWLDDAEAEYGAPFRRMKELVESARLLPDLQAPVRIRQDELDVETMWNEHRFTDIANRNLGYSTLKFQWKHLRLHIPESMLCEDPGKSIGDVKTNYEVLKASIQRYKRSTVKNLLTILEADDRSRSENFTGPVKWVLSLMDRLQAAKGYGGLYDNLLWHAASTVHIGYARVLNNVLGISLENLAGGMPVKDVLAIHLHKIDPNVFQRPQAPATEGNIKVAENLIEKKGLAPALLRRPLRPDEVVTFWNPPASKVEAKKGIFGDLVPKGETKSISEKDKEPLLELPVQAMDLEKFLEKILPEAKSIHLFTNMPGGFIGFMTQADPEAKPLLRWDHAEHRNPVNWFFHGEVNYSDKSGIPRNRWTKVTGLCKMPTQWGAHYEGVPHDETVFLLEGFRTQGNLTGCLFPGHVRGDLWEARATIEQFSSQQEVYAKEDMAGGLQYRNVLGEVRLRVVTDDGIHTIIIDREN